MPSPAELRKLIPAPPPPAVAPRPAPAPVPTPPPREARDRISVGAPSLYRQQGPIELEKDRDLSSAPLAPGAPTAGSAPQAAAEESRRGGDRSGAPAAKASPVPEAPDGRLAVPPRGEPSIGSSLRNLERRLGETGGGGLPGTHGGAQFGGFFFDPEGADFTAWLNDVKNDFYRNWIVPQSVIFGVGEGEAVFEVTVERNGTLSNLRLLQSTGNPALDRAAANAFLGIRFPPLPVAYGPPRWVANAIVTYGRRPRG